MPHIKVLRLILLTLSGILVPLVKTDIINEVWERTMQKLEPHNTEYPQGPIPTLWNDPPELPSGVGPLETTTTTRFSDSPGFPPYTSDYEPEDTTHLNQLDDGNGSLGPGAIGAIVIAALLGTSVIVALIVITLRKFSAS
ncbi:protein SNORC isoform X1 [Hemicordylus capensis]|uniref:protein SNORC isoform X1 n=1 Tax=Hemicordylus capensis TaxID=884348 RepID=UPI002302BF8E|nr:protein SNORC isoform X1 [Hemicordylus capensis]XP_053161237.1 protein SNORC isoform X1 [Hemicordylus capensis]